MDIKNLHLDGVAITRNELIAKAREENLEFDDKGKFVTLKAARALRKAGHVIGNLSEINK